MDPEKLRERSWRNWLRFIWQITPLTWLSINYYWRAMSVRLSAEGGKDAYQVAKEYGRQVLKRMGKEVVVIGQNHTEGLKYFAIAANHASYLDFAILLGYFPTPLRFIAKKELRYLPGFGRYLKSYGVLIDRKDRRSALTAIESAIHDGNSIPMLLFAEGTRSHDGVPKRFKPGGLSIIARNKVPVVPVTLINTFANLPRGAISYITGGKMKMIIGEPIQPNEFSDEKAFVEAVEKAVHQTFAQEQVNLLKSVA